MSKAEKQAVKVMVRVRPFNKRELELARQGDDGDTYPTSIVLMNENDESLLVLDQEGCIKDTFNFHKCFWSIPESQGQLQCRKQFTDQPDVYEYTGKPAVQAALAAKHVCIFAYGQTGSGKTYSMLGSVDTPGISPRIVDQVFDELNAMGGRQAGFAFTVEISFMEIYNERVKDLLADETFTGGDGETSPTGRRRQTGGARKKNPSLASPLSTRRGQAGEDGEYKDLKVRNSPVIGVFVEGLTRLGPEQGIKTAADVKQVMRAGMEHRATAETQMNATSSRSHAIFQLCIRSKNDAKGIHRYANINLVDLAGSERINLSGAEGLRLVEATRINQSLSTLRRVIDILIENTQMKKGQPKLVPPYRDSTLTWILSESLGGNSITMMLATVSPYEGNREDTINTLRYAFKAKSIVNNVRVNEEKGNVVLSAMQREMEELRKKLQAEAADPTSGVFLTNELSTLDAEKEKQEIARIEAEREIEQSLAELSTAIAEVQQKEEELLILQSECVEENREREHVAIQVVQDQFTRIRYEVTRRASEAEKKRGVLERETLERLAMAKQQEEMRLRQEEYKRDVQLSKRKQFALAFQKAFMRVGVGTDLAQLEDKVADIEDKVSLLQAELDETCFKIQAAEKVNQQLAYNDTRLQVDYTRSEKLRSGALATQQGIVNQQVEQKKSAEADCTSAKNRYKDVNVSLVRLQSSLDKKRLSVRRQIDQFNTRIEVFTKGKHKKIELVSQLKEQREVLLLEIETLIEARGHEQQRRDEVTAELKAARAEVATERGIEAERSRELRDLTVELDRNKLDLAVARERCQRLADVVEELSRNHGDLKKFVTFRFFAAGECESLDAMRGPLVDQFEGDRVWTKAGYAYRRSASPIYTRSVSPQVPTRSTSPRPITRTVSPLPIHGASISPRPPSRSASPVGHSRLATPRLAQNSVRSQRVLQHTLLPM
ncbi:Kinesin-like protein unc-104 [Diplonema papillatum]|nr:Kinesin-like protein unc-104 [Diplonema papillatum]